MANDFQTILQSTLEPEPSRPTPVRPAVNSSVRKHAEELY